MLNMILQNCSQRNISLANFTTNSAFEVREIMSNTLVNFEFILAEEDGNTINHMFLSSINIVEEMNATAHNISEALKLYTEKIEKTENPEQILEDFETLKKTVLAVLYRTVEKTVKVHPIWASMTLCIMFLPGSIFMVVFIGYICQGNILEVGFLGAVCVFLLAFCFPIGVIVSPICQAIMILIGSNEVIGTFEMLTGMAIGLEAFFESAPQIVLQLYIIFHTSSYSATQMVSILLSLIMLTKTTIMFELLDESDRPCRTILIYLLIQIPIYTLSVFFRLGSISLSCIIFGYWTFLPMILLLCIL